MADEFDTTLLISEVHKRPLLYCKSDQDYLNKAKKDQTWERIAVKFGTSAKNVRTKWSYLRDKFVKELRRTTTSDGAKISSWPHFQSMMFVRDSSKRKGSASHHHPGSLKVERTAAAAAATVAAAAAPVAAAESPAVEPNVKALIAEIRKRPLLYSRDDPNYQNKQRKEECWLDIFAALEGKMTVKQMKSKWTYLRDKLVKELKKSARSRRSTETRWIYFDSMAFVRDANKHYSDADYSGISYEAADSVSPCTEIDVDLLISEILKRPVLYDVNDENYRDQRIRDRVWEEIASLLGDNVTIEEVQVKWAGLRERFAKELLRTSRAANRGVRVRRRWEHYDKMMLLNECVENRMSNNRSVKSEAPLMIDGDGEYLNAAYLCADFAHINGDLEGEDSATFPTPIAVLSPSPVPMAGAADDGDPATTADEAITTAAAGGHNSHHTIGVAHLEEAVLRMVDIISNAVLSRRDDTSSSSRNSGSATVAAAAAATAANGAVSSNVSTSSPDAEDKSGNEPFLEYVRHYLRHTTLANNMELKRLVTQFMHSHPNSGD